MKKFLLILLIVASTAAVVIAAGDKPVTVDQLPTEAQAFLRAHFSDANVAYAKQDTDIFDRSYEVVLVDGRKIEFDSNGNWTDIDCKHGKVPSGAVPDAIENYVDLNFPNAFIIGLERDSRRYEAKLSNGLELKFDMAFNLYGIDD